MDFCFPLYSSCLCSSIVLEKAYLQSLQDAGEYKYLKCTDLKIEMELMENHEGNWYQIWKLNPHFST